MNAFASWPVVKYTGQNSEEVVAALQLEVGDCVVSGPERSYVIKAAEMQRLVDDALKGYRGFSWEL